MLESPATPEEVRTILEEVDDDTVRRVVATGASTDEIAEAIHLAGNNVARTEVASTTRVEEVRVILTSSSS